MSLKDKTFYTITTPDGQLALDVSGSTENGSLVRLNPQNGSDSQQWQIIYLPQADCFKLQNKASEKLLDTLVSGIEAGTWCQQWDDVDGDSQVWYVEETVDGCYKLKSKKSGRCLDIVAMAAVEGALLQIWDDVDGENQRWKFGEIPAAKKPAAKKPAAKKPAAKKPAAKKTEAAAPATEPAPAKKPRRGKK
ncbi:MAG: hypothetical protein HFG20_04720 [Anaerotruncus sp.]|jgi:hypothetical protein|nr:hypothetical protein [Anaerotruncus sp.]